MARKKKTRKRGQRRRSQPATAAPVTQASEPSATPVGPSRPTAPALAVSAAGPSRVSAGADTDRWLYVRGDLRRIGLFASMCVIVEVVLWLLFNHTGLGTAVYSLIKL